MRRRSRLGRWLVELLHPVAGRQAAEDDARHLLEAYGPHASRETRSRMRQARSEHRAERERHWNRVARAIARIEGRVIGETTADRYRS